MQRQDERAELVVGVVEPDAGFAFGSSSTASTPATGLTPTSRRHRPGHSSSKPAPSRTGRCTSCSAWSVASSCSRCAAGS